MQLNMLCKLSQFTTAIKCENQHWALSDYFMQVLLTVAHIFTSNKYHLSANFVIITKLHCLWL